MTMVLFYNRINWENYPSVVTPINETNLNKIDYAAKTLDERTVELYNTKADKSVLVNMIADWTLDENTGIITVTKNNGTVIKFDLNIEKIPVNFEMSEDGVLKMTTEDGSIFTADIGSMIPVIKFKDSDTISVVPEIDGNEKTYSISVKEGSIEDKYIEPNYLANIKNHSQSAELASAQAIESAKNAKSYSVGGTGTREDEDTDNAKYYMEEAKRAAQSGGGGGSIDLPVSIDNGGTGATTAKEAQYNLLSDISERTEEFTDDDYSTVLLATPNETNGLLAKFKITLLWDYIKEKISSALGLTETNYNGTSAKATADANGKVFSDTYATKEDISNLGGASNTILNTQTLGYTKKNLLKNTAVTTTDQGVNFTVNSDGSITVNSDGTATVNAKLQIAGGNYEAAVPLPDWLKIGESYIISDGVGATENTQPRVFIQFYSADENVQYFNQKFTVPDNAMYYGIRLVVPAGTVLNNVTFYPMIRSSGIDDDTYEPYVDDVYTRTTPVNNLLANIPGRPLDAVQGKALYDMMQWKYVEINGISQTIALPEGWKELKIIVKTKSDGPTIPVDFIRKIIDGDESVVVPIGGGAGNSSGTSILRGRLQINSNHVTLVSLYTGSLETPSDLMSTAQLYVWYR